MASAKFTVHKALRLDSDLDRRVRLAARHDHQNESETIRDLLNEALNARHQKQGP